MSAPDTNTIDGDIAAIARIDAVPMILDVVCRATGMGFAAVARVTEDRWVACSVKDTIDFGLGVGGELPVESTICHDIRHSGEGVWFDDAGAHPIFSSHHTPRTYGLKSYISLPIVLKDGTFFGTLCAVDPEPHKVDTPEIVQMFRLFAELIALHLSNNARIAASEALLVKEREAATLREQFIAVLSHDLRNPLGAIASGAALLQKSVADDRGRRLATMIEKSAWRMTEMIESLLDFARSRLGAGVSLNREPFETLEPNLIHVVNEVQAAFPDRAVETDFRFHAPIIVDAHRIGQMVSNLIGNAFSHGDPETPVRLRAVSGDGMFLVTVSNGGKPIAPEVMDILFQPFRRGSDSAQNGLGLGLYIASEIARAHGGTLRADSSPQETVFRFAMPLEK